jgi:hypothetical protein
METRIASRGDLLLLLRAIVLLLCVGLGASRGSANQLPSGHSEASRDNKVESESFDNLALGTPTCWNLVPSPNGMATSSSIIDISALSADDIWAVGLSLGYRLVEHWDGTAWSVVTLPANVEDGRLLGVAAISPDNVWAVGAVGANNIVHWDGSTWSEVTGLLEIQEGYLNDISAVSANDIWVVGKIWRNDTERTISLHWNGTSWVVVPTPNAIASTNELKAVKAISSNDVWAVGTMMVHWDGNQWNTVIIPDTTGSMEDIDASASNDVWVVGSYYNTIQQTYSVLIWRWDGISWSILPSPSPGRLYGVNARAPDDVWAVGSYVNEPNRDRTLALRWDGTNWTQISTTDPGDAVLRQVVSLSTNDVWAVGRYVETTYFNYRTLLEHYSLTAFTDVPPENPFYSQVQCLVCKGIISGYDDGTFRPNNNVTRGQLAKIVSNSAGFTQDPGPQLFEDIAPGNTFYDWVNRLASLGHIGGYACGGEGEPCGPDNLPYFRPNANATRGQISKIVSNAAGFSDPATTQTFEDVIPDSTFYLWVERLASRGIMGGYQCGGEGEPCGPDNLPYFRPGNNATRGQSSKIVANTFFPGCQTPLRH